MTFHVNVVAMDHRHTIEFSSGVDSPEAEVGTTIVALMHLAVISLNSECDEVGSVITVHLNGQPLRTITGPALAELGRRVRRSSTEVIASWWNETSTGLHPAPRG